MTSANPQPQSPASEEPFRPRPSARPRGSGRDFFWLLVRRDLKSRYAGSTLGGIWNLIHPITMILIYIAVFSSLFAERAGGHPANYTIHLCSGMLVWLVFSDTLSRSVTTLTDHGSFLLKISFPPALLHASVLFNVLLVHGAGLTALALILTLIGSPPAAQFPLTYGLMILLGFSALGLGLLLSILHVFFRDTAQIVGILLQVGFWLNPVVYYQSKAAGTEHGWWSAILMLNPVAHFVTQAQAFFGDAEARPWPLTPLVVLIFPAGCLLLGWWAFQRMLPEVRDGL